MSYKAQIWARPLKMGNPTVKAVLNAIAFFADDDGMTWRLQKEIAEYTEFTDRAVRGAIATLVERGLLTRRMRFRRDGSRQVDVLILALNVGGGQYPDNFGLGCEPGETYVIFDEPPTQPKRPYGVKQSAWNRLRRQVLDRDGHACTYCGSQALPLHCDHVVPWSKGGATAVENFTTACGPCNIGEKNRTAEQWIAILRARAPGPAPVASEEADPCP